MPGDRGRADVDGDAVGGVDVARPDGDDQSAAAVAVAAAATVAAPSSAASSAVQRRAAPRPVDAGHVERRAGRRRRRCNSPRRARPRHRARAGGDLDVEERERRVDDDRRRGRGPCGRPGGAPGSSPARRSTTSPTIRAAQPSRLAGGERAVAVVVDLDRRRRARARRGAASIAPLGERPDAGRRPGSDRRCRGRRTPCRGRRRAGAPRRARSCRRRPCRSRPDGVKTTRCDAATAAVATRSGAGGADPRGRRRSPTRRGGSRLARIHAAQSRSVPASTSAASTADFTSGCIGFMIADVIPAPIAIARNVPVTTWRLGSPKLTFDAPHVVLTLSSSRSRRIRRNACWPAWPRAPIGITSGSTTTSCGGDAVVGGALDDALGDREAHVGIHR